VYDLPQKDIGQAHGLVVSAVEGSLTTVAM
jgi:hypothetical protein